MPKLASLEERAIDKIVIPNLDFKRNDFGDLVLGFVRYILGEKCSEVPTRERKYTLGYYIAEAKHERLVRIEQDKKKVEKKGYHGISCGGYHGPHDLH